VRHGQKQAGLVGQEVEDIIPAAVPRRADDYRLIDPMALIATLVNSVNELAAKVEMLERG
jgi:hypothetical protein